VRYQQICPVSLASEVLAERWTPLILREIVLFGQTHFSEIQRGVGRISQSLLAERLRTLETAGIIERRPNRTGRGWTYHPTEAGRELETVLNELGIWAQHWIELRQEHCEPSYLMTTVHSLLQADRLPAARSVVRFEFAGAPQKPYWLVLAGEQSELCFNDPGPEPDLVVTVDEQAFGGVLLGRVRYADALARGDVRFEGRSDLAKAFPTWLGMTRFARYAIEQPPTAVVGASV
jgi:DNA-binding HxlR family transcriptional regulator